jgi:hypothetical protein
MKFMSENIMEYFPPPETPEEKLVHVLGIMKNATRTRLRYFNYRHEQHEKYLSEKVEFDKETNLPVSKDRVFEAIHVDYTFSAIQAIETLHGVLLVAYMLMNNNYSNLEDAISTLINPGSKLDIIHNILSNETLSRLDICNISAIPYLDSFNSQEQEFLERVLAPTMHRISDLCKYSQAFLDLFKPVRNVFAHNFRFIFFDEVVASEKSNMAETIVGFLEPGNVAINNILLIGYVQKLAFRELVLALGVLELNILVGLVDFVLNGLKPVLPRRLVIEKNNPDLSEYTKFWNSQGYNFPDPRRNGAGRGDIGIQKGLYHDFMNYVTKKMDREIIAVGLDGTKRIAKFEETPPILKKKLRDKQTQLRERRRPKKKRK